MTKNRIFISLLFMVSMLFACNPVIELIDTRVIDAEFSISDVEEGDSSVLSIFLKEGEDSCDYFISWASGSLRDSTVIPMKIKETHLLPLTILSSGIHEVSGKFRRADGGANVIPFTLDANVTKKSFKASMSVDNNEEGTPSTLVLKLNSGENADYVLAYSIDGGNVVRKEVDLAPKETRNVDLGCLKSGKHTIDAELSRKDGYGTPVDMECSWEVTLKVSGFKMTINDVEEGEKATVSLIMTEGEGAEYSYELFIDDIKTGTGRTTLKIGKAFEIKVPAQKEGIHKVSVSLQRTDGLGTPLTLSGSFKVLQKSFAFEASIAEVQEGEMPQAKVTLTEGDEGAYKCVISVDNKVISEEEIEFSIGKPVLFDLPSEESGYHEFKVIMSRTDGLGASKEITGTFNVKAKSFSVTASVSTVIYGKESTLLVTLKDGDDASYDIIYSVDKGTQMKKTASLVKGTAYSISLGKCSEGSHSVAGTVKRSDGLGSEKSFSVTYKVDADLSPDEVVFSKNKFSVSMDQSISVTVKIDPVGANQLFTVERYDSGSAKATFTVSGNTITVKGGSTGGQVKLKVASKEDSDVWEYLTFYVKHRVALALDIKSQGQKGRWAAVTSSASLKVVKWTGTISPTDASMSGVTLYDFSDEKPSYKADVYIHANPLSIQCYSLHGNQPYYEFDTNTDYTYDGITQSGRQWCLWKNRVLIKSNINASPFKAQSVSTSSTTYTLSSLLSYLQYNNNWRKWHDGWSDWWYNPSSPGKNNASNGDPWSSFYLSVTNLDFDWDKYDVEYIFHLYRTKPGGSWYSHADGYWWQIVDSGNWAVPVSESNKN